ncbi:TetR/AcrR family transcriptional regulator [Agrobacterium rosae]|uniref:TetR/AcrR family transcriptional regulator n=1 Tax=Agrobacterium rosae TaxID=1972867 RepID=UPI000CD84B5A|nr:TetR/AcrR family transcriptional regulator [Agrobacterium rosae]POO51772.1 TetR family transcriptional regulator [Agrobacterium rosae]
MKPYHHGSLRQALLDAAEAILDRDGIDGLTLRAAAREAGVSHGAPAHHFGDLSGLLTELAASGFVRLRETVLTEVAEAAGQADPSAYTTTLGRGYIRFARAHPGVFLLMFRSERLNWCSPSLSVAGPAAFALLSSRASGETEKVSDFEELIVASTRWSLMHGLATLIIDGRLAAMAQSVPGADLEQLIGQVLSRGLGVV